MPVPVDCPKTFSFGPAASMPLCRGECCSLPRSPCTITGSPSVGLLCSLSLSPLRPLFLRAQLNATALRYRFPVLLAAFRSEFCAKQLTRVSSVSEFPSRACAARSFRASEHQQPTNQLNHQTNDESHPPKVYVSHDCENCWNRWTRSADATS